MTDWIQKISDGLVHKLMDVEWLFTTILLVSFVDMYTGVKYKVPLLAVLRDWKDHPFGLSDVIFALLLFSFIFVVIFPVAKVFYYNFIFGQLEKLGLKMIEDPLGKDYKIVAILKRKAAQENNIVLWNLCMEKQQQIKSQSFIFSAAWGIVAFSIVHSLFSLFGSLNSHPLLIDFGLQMIFFAENANKFISFILLSLFMIVSLAFASLLWTSLKIGNEGYIHFPDNKDRS